MQWHSFSNVTFHPLQPVSTKYKASDVCKKARAVCKKATNQPTDVSSPHQVTVAVTWFAASVVASDFIVPPPLTIDSNACVAISPYPLLNLFNPLATKRGSSTVML